MSGAVDHGRWRRPGAWRGGVVLVGVLIIVVVLALLAGTALVMADAEATAARGALRREQSRSTAWSGVQAVMAELGQQREGLLNGQAPQLTASWVLFGESGGPRAVVRLLELEPGRMVSSEAGKLDLNTVSAAMLTASGAMDIGGADAVVSARASAPFGSVAEAMAAVPAPKDATTAFEGDLAGRRAEPLAGEVAPDRRLTVFSFEPNRQAGIGGGEAGAERLFIGEGWSDDLKAPLQERLEAKTAAAVEKTLRAGAPKSMGDVIAGLRREQIAVKEWASVLDALTISPDAYLAGRIDIHTAPVEVLRAVPGMTDALAEQIERLRDRIDAESRMSVVWLVQQGVMTPGQFQGVVDHITSRCLQWRVRVEGGFGSAGEESSAVRDRVVLEAVVDLSGARPRLAYLRDVTHLDSVELVRAASDERGGGAPGDERELEKSADLDLGVEMEEIGLELDGGLGAEAGGDLGLAPMEMDAGLDLGIDGPAADREDQAAGPAVKGASSGVDRRVGRWKIPAKPATSAR